MGSHTILTSELFPGFSYDEALADQETLYEALKIIASDQASSLATNDVDSHLQLAIDEALARSLQELEDGIDNVSIINEEITPHNASEDAPTNAPRSLTTTGPIEDDAVPELTYEEMQSLGEAMESKSKGGLPEEDINLLPSFKFKSGFFLNKRKAREYRCTICISEFKKKQYLTALPCAHQYHKECITRWLKDNKNCPICQGEVKLSP